MDKSETTGIIDNFNFWKTQINAIDDNFYCSAPKEHLSVIEEVFGDSSQFMAVPVVMVNGTTVAAQSFSIDARTTLQEFKSFLEDLQKRNFILYKYIARNDGTGKTILRGGFKSA